MSSEVLELEARLKDHMSTEIDKISKSMTNFGQTTKRAMEETDSSIKKVLTTAGGFALGQLGVSSFGQALGTLRTLVVSSVGAFDKQIAAQSLLRNAIGYTSTALLEQASVMQRTTRFADEDVVSAQARLAMFIKEEDQIKRLVPLVADFAAAKQMDLASAADLVGKSIGSETSALSRYGISVEGAAGSTERINSLFTNMSRLVDGAASSISSVGSGPMVQMANAIDDQKEKLGEYITKAINPYVTAINDHVLPALASWLDGMLKISDDAQLATIDESIKRIRKKIEEETAKGPKSHFMDMVTGGAAGMNAATAIASSTLKSNMSTLTAELDALMKQRESIISERQKKTGGGGGVVPGLSKEDLTAAREAGKEINDRMFEDAKALEEKRLELIKQVAEAKKSLREEEINAIANDSDRELQKLLFKYEEELAAHKNNAEAKAIIDDKYMVMYDAKLRELKGKEAEATDKQAKADKDIYDKKMANIESNTDLVIGSFKKIATATKASAGVQRGLDIAQATANTALAVTKSLATPWMIPFIIASGAAQIAIISQQKYASGGIVGGNSSTGDRIPALVNSGEMILNKDQQANLFNMIQRPNTVSTNNAVSLNINVGAGGNYDMTAAQHTVDSLVPIIGRALLQAKNEGRLRDYEYAR